MPKPWKWSGCTTAGGGISVLTGGSGAITTTGPDISAMMTDSPAATVRITVPITDRIAEAFTCTSITALSPGRQGISTAGRAAAFTPITPILTGSVTMVMTGMCTGLTARGITSNDRGPGEKKFFRHGVSSLTVVKDR